MPNMPHLVERAAARLAASGAIPGALAAAPVPRGDAGTSPTAPAPLSPDTPRLAVVTRAALERAGLMSGRVRAAEELWLIQRQVLRAAFAQESADRRGHANLLMVTSARAGEGKTFTALNLAASVALQGDHPVLLVDADTKEGSLSERVGLRDTPGLLDLAAEGGLDAARLERPAALSRLSILPIGRARAHGADLLASRSVSQLLHGLARREADRLVILDAPPCLATSDPAALAPVVGQTILVVEAERTQRTEVEAALDLIQDCPAITLVLNKMRHDGGHAFGAASPYSAS